MIKQKLSSTSFSHYLTASENAANEIIRSYSTSFGIATRFLGERHRVHVRNIYALVRVADELVDGVTQEVGLNSEQQAESLDALEAETYLALKTGYSSNPIVQAFANTARVSGIDDSLITPFFSSMRMDLENSNKEQNTIINFDNRSHAGYVFGSAEVVGLMCLKIFTREENMTMEERNTLERGARSLGAAFQNVNFLRDLADDTQRLSRNYLSDGAEINEALKAEWVNTVNEQLKYAKSVIGFLPKDAQTGVDCAYRLFSKLNKKIAATAVSELFSKRVSVSKMTKLWLLLQAIVSTRFLPNERL